MIRCLAALLLASGTLAAQVPEGFDVADTPGDAGGSVIASWKRLPKEDASVTYVVSVSRSKDGPWEEAVRFPATTNFKSDAPKYFGYWSSNRNEHFFEIPAFEPGEGEKGPLEVWVRLEVITPAGTAAAVPLSATPLPNWWSWPKTNVFVFICLFGVATFYLIRRARRDPNLFIRRIPGLDAMEEAIGRATEMGKPILYLNGLDGMSSISTIAATCILGQVARRVAAYDTQISVPCYDPVVMSVCQEVMREAFYSSGRPDSYRPESAFFVTNDQFGYVAAVDGIMMREKPAACFYFGFYYAESLLLAETGGTTGAIQIAGTDSVTQLPFFIASCDYTLIGEELYAASAYLSREPIQLGSLVAQDWGKIAILGVLLLGTLASLARLDFLKHLLATF